jgi:membrane protein implicated in regulation of membrane protease activity
MENLELQQMETLFFVLFGLIAVIVVALVVYVVVANRRQRTRMVQAYEADKLTPRPARRMAGQVLSLVRDEAGGGLQVEIGGVKYRRLADIRDPQIRRQVVGVALELIQFTGVLGQELVPPASLEETPSWREDLRKSSESELEQIRATPTATGLQTPAPPTPEEIEERFLSLLAEMGQASPSLDKPSIVGAIQQRLAPKQVEPERARTFVDDIDDIVQRRAQLIPALVGKDLHVRLGPGDSVRFVFEGRAYEGLDEVPNMTARQLIKDAIQEWEETT